MDILIIHMTCTSLVHHFSCPSIFTSHVYNESTAGADASVEMPNLHNIKLLIAFMHMINNLILLHAKTHRVGNDLP